MTPWPRYRSHRFNMVAIFWMTIIALSAASSSDPEEEHDIDGDEYDIDGIEYDIDIDEVGINDELFDDDDPADD